MMTRLLALLAVLALAASAAWAHPQPPLLGDDGDGPKVRQIRPDVYVVEGEKAEAKEDQKDQADQGDDADDQAADADEPEADKPEADGGAEKPEPGPMNKLAGEKQPAKPAKAPTTQPDPTADMTLHLRGPARLKLGNYEGATKDFEQLLLSKEHRQEAIIGLATIARRTGDLERAAKVLADAREAIGNTAEWRLAQAELLTVSGKYEEALKLAEGVLAENKENLHARWIAGQMLEALGRYDQAKATYKWVDEWVTRDRPADAPGKTWAGQCLDRYSRLIGNPVKYGQMILQDLYQSAYEDVDREYWPARVAGGRLSLEAYKVEQAASDFMMALRVNPKAYEARLGIGWALLEMWRFEDVEKQLAEIRKVNPNEPDAWELESALLMAQRKFEDAAKAAEKGLAVNPRHVRLLALLASAKMRMGDEAAVEQITEKAKAINPEPAEFYHIIGQMEAAARQFDSGEKYCKLAIKLAPWDPNPRTSLGMLWMQTGNEVEAHKILEEAFAIDKYNKRTWNTLTLLDQLVAFDRIETENFIVKFNASTDAVLGPYFSKYLEGIYAEISRDYGVKLDRKSTIEIFPKHEQFSVRVTGRSWIPTVGACTGWVVAMYSPKGMVGKMNPRTGEPMGFNWATVLRHEFTHVVTLAATGNRIPHWFTEGLAVTQEPGPRPWRFVQALQSGLRQDQLFKIDEINWGFIRPRRPSDRQLAYAQSEWMVEFIVETWGYKSIMEMIHGFRDKLTQPQVFQKVLGVTEKEFDAKFRTWARAQVKEVWRMSVDPIPTLAEAEKAAKEKPNDAAVLAKLAVAQFYNQRDRQRVAKAEKTARKALEIDANEPTALDVVATIVSAQSHRDAKKWPEAEQLLRRLAEVDPNNATAPRELARRALNDDNMNDAAFWFERLKLASPLEPTSYAGLAGIYLSLGQNERALPELAELAKREMSDPRYALKLASIYTAIKQPDQAAWWLEQAMEIDPFNAEVHKELAVAYVDSKQPKKAIEELKVAIQLDPKNAGYWTRLAYVYDAQDEPRLAKMAAQFAVKLDPESPAAELLLKFSPPATQPDERAEIDAEAIH